MPGLDGMGPTGQGPLTGYGGGYCIAGAGERTMLGVGRGYPPRGCGSGRCFGGRRFTRLGAAVDSVNGEIARLREEVRQLRESMADNARFTGYGAGREKD